MMSKFISSVALGAIVAVGTLFGMTTVAYANTDTYVQEALDTLASQPVHVDSTMSQEFNEKGLLASVADSDIAVVVFPDDAFTTYSSVQSAKMILNSGLYDTILVARDTGQPRIVVASVEASTEYNVLVSDSLRANPGDVEAALLDSVSEIKNNAPKSQETTQPTTTSGAEGTSDFMVRLLLIGLVLATILVLVYYIFFRKEKTQETTPTVKVDNRFGPDVPESVEKELRGLNELRKRYKTLAGTVTTQEAVKLTHMNNQMGNLINSVQQLFTRLEKRNAGSQKLVAEVEYTDRLKKLASLLGETYYLDYVVHPNAWDKVEERKANVEEALESINRQVIKTIQEVNSSQDIDIKVILDAIIRADGGQVDVEDFYKKTTENNEKKEEGK